MPIMRTWCVSARGTVMKKIISMALCLVIIASALLTLSSCKKGDGAPEGMQLVMGSDAIGFYFYGPEGWEIANRNNIACTYATKANTDRTSFTLVESEAPQVIELDGVRNRKAETEGYFESYKESYPAPVTVTSPITKATFGNATDAYSVVLSYTYAEYSIKCMQIFAYFGESFYIFTFTSFGAQRSEGETYYDYHLRENATKVINSVKFVDKNGETPKPTVFETDADGYKLISDKAISGFKLYVPSGYTPDFASGMAIAYDGEGRSINAAEPTYAYSGFDEYWEARKLDLGNLVSNLTFKDEDIKVVVQHPDARGAASYEYSYEYCGAKYRVYQVIMVSLTRSFIFTYTAEESVFESGLAEAKAAFLKFRF